MRISRGWLEDARHSPSPNFNERPAGCEITLLVIHNISLPPGEFGGSWIDDLFHNRLDPDAHSYFREIEGLEVSAHCLIRRDGEIIQYVCFDKRAWHAGQSSYCGIENCNDFSIGIELEGTDEEPFTDAQYSALALLTAAIRKNYPSITEERIVGHSDIAPGRKTDPGMAFDWHRYRKLAEQC